MADALKRYIPRAPRYVLSPEDNKLLYFAQGDSKGEKHQTELIDVSVSGLSFLAERDLAPNLGDMIKFEFTSPGEDKVAWWGRVVRVEDFTDRTWWKNSADDPDQDLIVVALKFDDMPTGHKNKVHRGVEKRLKQIKRKQQLRDIRFLTDFVFDYKWQILIYLGCIFGTFYFLWALAQPTHEYTEERGSKWGQRYKSLMWTPDKPNK